MLKFLLRLGIFAVGMLLITSHDHNHAGHFLEYIGLAIALGLTFLIRNPYPAVDYGLITSRR